MGFSMIIYGVTPKKDGKCLTKLVSWKNHYLLNMWFSIELNNGNDTEGLLISFEDAIYILKEDCQKAIIFLRDHVTEYRLHPDVPEFKDLVGEWEYKWDEEIPENPFFKYDFRFYLGRYGVDGFINYLTVIIEFIDNYEGKYDEFMYELL